MHVMIQVLKGGEGPHLPHGLSVVNMYTKVISLFPRVISHQAVAANAVPPCGIGTQNFEGAR